MTKTIWKGKTEVEPNFWGLNRPNKGLGFSMTSQSSGHNEPSSPIAALFGFMFLYPVFLGLMYLIPYGYFISDRVFFIISTVIYCSSVVYYLFIREIKYYQLAKKTTYEITEDEIIFYHKFSGFKRSKKIPFSNIKLFHLVKFQVGDIEKGSIFIYTKTKVRTYDIGERERNTIPKIERITEYNQVCSTLISLLKRHNTPNTNTIKL